MKDDSFREHYQALGLAPGCSWQELRDKYRRLVKIWHPDRLSAHSQTRDLAQERIKAITLAFRRFSEYQRAYGHLPGERPSAAPTSEPAATRTTSADRAVSQPPPRPKTATESLRAGREPENTQYVWFTMGGIALLTAVLALTTGPFVREPDPEPGTDSKAAALPGRETTPSEPNKSRYFTVGSLMGEVYEAQGAPTRVDADVWHYGKARVHFANGRVIAWEHEPPSLLNARFTPVAESADAAYFTIGTPKKDVRSIQGPPTRQAPNEWVYGNSKVYFSDDRVTGWHEATRGDLKVPH